MQRSVGYGKPLGFGTVKVTIEEIALLPPNRYENWDINYTPLDKLSAEAMGIEGILALPSPDIKARWQVMSGDERRNYFAKALIERFFQAHFGRAYDQADQLPHWRDLRHLLSWHSDYDQHVHYPERQWFDSKASVSLPTTEEIEGSPPGDRSKWLRELNDE